MKLDPLSEFFPQSRWRDPDRSDTSGLTCLLQLFSRERVDTLGVNHLFVIADVAPISLDHARGHGKPKRTMSSTRIFSNLALIWCFKKLSVPKALMFMYLHMLTS